MNIKKLTKKSLYVAVPAIIALSSPMTAHATNGYFSHGIGIKAKAMGGVGIAKSRDSLAAGTNPANMVSQGNRFDFGLDKFKPRRTATVQGAGFSANEDSEFYIPEFGYNQLINDSMSFGVSVYGNGGMNTSYSTPIGLFGSTNAGVNLEQLFIAPTFSMKAGKNTFGVALNIIQQKFRATGLENFDSAAQSSAPGSVTNNGDDTSNGFNVRLGWTLKASEMFSIGAMYQSKADMDNFDKYKGLFAEQGDFDIPSTYGIGINYSPTKSIDIGLDVVKINYSEVAAISNKLGPVSGGGQLQNTLGDDNGAGFGWEDMTVYKLGAAFKVNNSLNILMGYNYGKQPIPADQTFFNLLAPAVTEKHYTLGFSMGAGENAEVTVMYMYAPQNTVNGSGSIPAAFGGGEANLTMSQNSLGVAYGWNF